MIIVTGDMSVKAGYDNRYYERVMGKHGLGLSNDNNGERLCVMWQSE